MAKKKKTRRGFSELKEYNKSIGLPEEAEAPDFKKYAEEYQKLLNKRYVTKLNNGQIIKLVFQEGNFYHLLGFHKFKQTIFEAMIKDRTVNYTPSDFYKDVQAGNISYSDIDTSKITIPSNLNVSDYKKFGEHEATSEISDVLNRRFPYFTYNNVLSILRNKVVIDFEKDSHRGEIRATKIFFCFLDVTQRNLNLFLDCKEGEYFSTSFFLENSVNAYKKKKDGTDMDMLDVLSMYIVDEENHSEIEFYIDWSRVSSYVLEQGNYPEYSEMKRLYNKKDITVSLLKEQMDILKSQLENIETEISILKKENNIKEMILKYVKASAKEDKEIIQLQMMDYDMDIESLVLDEKLIDKEVKKLQNDVKEKRERIKRIQKKITKTENALPQIQLYEIQKVKEIYQPLIERSEDWNSGFWTYLLEKCNLFETTVSPKTVKTYYKAWKKEYNKSGQTPVNMIHNLYVL